MGAEGWEASNNLVLLDSAVVQSQSIKTRKLGIVGGRGFFDYRIYDSSDSDYDTKNNTIANGNVVIIKNSIISDADLISDETGEVHGMSIFGGGIHMVRPKIILFRSQTPRLMET